MRFLKLFLFTVVLFPSISAAAMETPDLEVHLAITGMKEPGPPQFIGENLVLSYGGSKSLRFVGAAFEHEHFREVHSFYINRHGVYVLIYPLPEDREITELRYRIVADGLWLPDPNNPETVTDLNGLKLSLQKIPDRYRSITDVPLMQKDGETRFIYYGPSGSRVYIAGDFNNWDPFMHRLNETTPGTYEISLRLQPGRHFYYFVSNGLKVLDPRNPQRGIDYEGDEASYYVVEASRE